MESSSLHPSLKGLVEGRGAYSVILFDVSKLYVFSRYPTSIFVIYLPGHYVTLIVDGEKYYFYDSLEPKSKVRV